MRNTRVPADSYTSTLGTRTMNSAKGPLAGRYLSRGTTTQVDRLFIFPNPFAFFVFRLERQNSLEL